MKSEVDIHIHGLYAMRFEDGSVGFGLCTRTSLDRTHFLNIYSLVGNCELATSIDSDEFNIFPFSFKRDYLESVEYIEYVLDFEDLREYEVENITLDKKQFLHLLPKIVDAVPHLFV